MRPHTPRHPARLSRWGAVLLALGLCTLGAPRALAEEADLEAEAPLAMVFTRFQGPGASVLARQLEEALCVRLSCAVPRGSSGLQPRRDVDGVLFAQLKQERGGRHTVSLKVVTPRLKPLARLRLTLSRSGELLPRDVRKVRRTLLYALTRAREANGLPPELESLTGPGPVPSAPSALAAAAGSSGAGAEEAPSSDEPAPVSDARLERTSDAGPDERSAVDGAQRSGLAEAVPAQGRPPPPIEDGSAGGLGSTPGLAGEVAPRGMPGWLIVSVQGQLVSRQLAFSGLETRGTRATSGVLFTPLMRLEAFPLARLGLGAELRVSGTLQGVPVAQAGGATLGLQSQELLASWRFFPVPALELRAQAGARRRAAIVSRTAEGPYIDAPGVDYRGWTAGGAASWSLPFGWRLEGRAAYLGVLDSGELISEAYFRSGRTHGVEGSLGLGVRVWGPMELVASGDAELYQHSFQTAPDDLYVARGARDLFLGASLGVRTRL